MGAGESTRLEMWVGRTDRRIAEAERTGGLEAEAPVEGRVTEEHQQRPVTFLGRVSSVTTSALPTPRPCFDVPTQTGATPATGVGCPSR